jgi:hypothetical protein
MIGIIKQYGLFIGPMHEAAHQPAGKHHASEDFVLLRMSPTGAPSSPNRPAIYRDIIPYLAYAGKQVTSSLTVKTSGHSEPRAKPSPFQELNVHEQTLVYKPLQPTESTECLNQHQPI